jgi:pyruvate,water dikinase
MRFLFFTVAAGLGLALALSCGGSSGTTWECALDDGADFATTIGCEADFLALASRPLDASIPGSRSVKTIVDREADGALSFQDSNRFPTHYEFASTHLSGNGRPVVLPLSSFNTTEYYSPSRRFVLGALTHYEQPDIWVYELAPYDTADAAMIADAYARIAAATYVGDRLYFHPSSESGDTVVGALPASVRVITTDELYAGIDYQALNPAESYGKLRFLGADQLESEYLSFRDIVVLDHVPNDISVAMGIITAEFQTPLSHVNVLSRNRGTPNMALRDAFTDPALRGLEGNWVKLTVGAFDYQIAEVPVAEADAWWEAHKPAAVQVPGLDLDTTDLRDDLAIVDLDAGLGLRDAVKLATRAFGGKAAHFGALAHVAGVPRPKGFAIPVAYYWQFMQQNGFDARIAALLANPTFVADAAVRDRELAALRTAMKAAPVDAGFEALLTAKLAADYPGVRMRFRSSTNAEDLDGFTGAGLYTSESGEPGDPDQPVTDAIREVWASVWFFRAFEERSYRSIDHTQVGMALLVHRSFPDEEANGVALTANPYDTAGLEPAFYVNVQVGGESVVLPASGVTTDQILYYHAQPGQPVVYVARSNLIPTTRHVLTDVQLAALGDALARIHDYFAPAYGPTAADPDAWYAMDIEFKFEGEPGAEPALFVKQARPHGQ